MYLKKGFTLIELLIVIVIIGILAGLVVTNLVGGRERAQDSSKKRNLEQLKISLHLYYTDFGHFPNSPQNNGANFYACGEPGTALCSSTFTANNKEYMGKLPKNQNGQNNFSYYPCGDGEDFRLTVNLANASDPDATESQSRCPADTCVGQTLSFDPTDYVLCGN
jgi:general secretion pathway protein G